ncbi:hypothetical protein EON63_17255 [archaeon]|nr:MAG: hypothetical protein EON63_17255 [archaeon]
MHGRGYVLCHTGWVSQSTILQHVSLPPLRGSEGGGTFYPPPSPHLLGGAANSEDRRDWNSGVASSPTGCIVYGMWCMVYGAWCMVCNVCCMVHGL